MHFHLRHSLVGFVSVTPPLFVRKTLVMTVIEKVAYSSSTTESLVLSLSCPACS